MTFWKEFVFRSFVTFASIPRSDQVNQQWWKSETAESLTHKIPTIYKTSSKNTQNHQYLSNYFLGHHYQNVHEYNNNPFKIPDNNLQYRTTEFSSHEFQQTTNAPDVQATSNPISSINEKYNIDYDEDTKDDYDTAHKPIHIILNRSDDTKEDTGGIVPIEVNISSEFNNTYDTINISSKKNDGSADVLNYYKKSAVYTTPTAITSTTHTTTLINLFDMENNEKNMTIYQDWNNSKGNTNIYVEIKTEVAKTDENTTKNIGIVATFGAIRNSTYTNNETSLDSIALGSNVSAEYRNTNNDTNLIIANQSSGLDNTSVITSSVSKGQDQDGSKNQYFIDKSEISVSVGMPNRVHTINNTDYTNISEITKESSTDKAEQFYFPPPILELEPPRIESIIMINDTNRSNNPGSAEVSDSVSIITKYTSPIMLQKPKSFHFVTSVSNLDLPQNYPKQVIDSNSNESVLVSDSASEITKEINEDIQPNKNVSITVLEVEPPKINLTQSVINTSSPNNPGGVAVSDLVSDITNNRSPDKQQALNFPIPVVDLEPPKIDPTESVGDTYFSSDSGSIAESDSVIEIIKDIDQDKQHSINFTIPILDLEPPKIDPTQSIGNTHISKKPGSIAVSDSVLEITKTIDQDRKPSLNFTVSVVDLEPPNINSTQSDGDTNISNNAESVASYNSVSELTKDISLDKQNLFDIAVPISNLEPPKINLSQSDSTSSRSTNSKSSAVSDSVGEIKKDVNQDPIFFFYSHIPVSSLEPPVLKISGVTNSSNELIKESDLDKNNISKTNKTDVTQEEELLGEEHEFAIKEEKLMIEVFINDTKVEPHNMLHDEIVKQLKDKLSTKTNESKGKELTIYIDVPDKTRKEQKNIEDIVVPYVSEPMKQDKTEQDGIKKAEEDFNPEDELDVETGQKNKFNNSESATNLEIPKEVEKAIGHNTTANNNYILNPENSKYAGNYIGFSLEAAKQEGEFHRTVSYEKCIDYTGSRGGIGGEDAELGEFPHMAAIGWRKPSGGYTFKCGGSLISEKFILTAAHCLMASPRDADIVGLEPAVVRLGEQNIFRDDDGAMPIDYTIKRTIPHPHYRSPRKYNDIGLIELDKEVVMTEAVRPACLSDADHDWMGGLVKEAIVTGWGTTSQGSMVLSAVLQKVYVDVLDSRRCDDLLRNQRNRLWQGLTDQQVCAGVLQGGRDACYGDSGGPLQRTTGEAEGARFSIVGVTSFGFGCGNKNLPGVYTRVLPYTSWIESVVWPGVNITSF